MRPTSIEVYNEIKASGLLSHMRFKVYDYVFHNGPVTSRELDAALADENETRTSYHKRLSELERMGVICPQGVRQCRVSGNNVLEWEVTGRVAKKHERERPKEEQYRQALDRVAEDIETDPYRFTAIEIAVRLRGLLSEIG